MGGLDPFSTFESTSSSLSNGSTVTSRNDHWHIADQSGLPLEFSQGTPVLPGDYKSKKNQIVVKRIADVLISTAALLILAPLLLIIACLIKSTSTGPILFTQTREGLNGQIFRMYKFRSLQWSTSDHSGLKTVTSDDPRLTRIGGFLRRTSIDELPQLINILRGDMSLIGPRPQVPGMLIGARRYDQVVPYYHLRHAIKPGLTGWAQANGLRGTVDTAPAAKARVDHDLAYISNFSLALDVKILFWTLWKEVVQLGRGS